MEKLSYPTGAMADKRDGAAMHSALKGLYDRMSSQAFNSGAIAAAGTATKVKTAAAVNGIAGGLPVTLPATDNLYVPLVGTTVSAGATNVFCLYVDAAGAVTSAFGREATTGTVGLLNNSIIFPAMPEKKMMIGFVIISAAAAAWTAGTNDFATAGEYTVTFVNTVGMFDPSAII